MLISYCASSIVLLVYFLSCAEGQSPNILFILMDDLGYSDVGFADNRFHTPTIDAMRNGKSAIRFDRSYTPPNCAPSRTALLSGIYPWRMGLQGNAIDSASTAAIPKSKTILPEALKDLGYQTHLVGKWHQGFCKKSQTPNQRGFDSFYGFYLTKQDYYSHVSKKEGYDFRSNYKVDRSVQGQYSTYIYSERVRELIKDYKDSLDKNAAKTKPFFIMLSHAAIHGPNQVPEHYINDHCMDIPEVLRRQKCGMMAAVDEGLKNITDDLKNMGLMDDLLIVFTSDDGGKTDEGSSNWPLRGAKRTMWEGGIRVNTFMYSEDSDVLPKTDFTYKGLFYMTDFYATLVGMATDDVKSRKFRGLVDSYNQWKFLKKGQAKKTYRKDIFYVDQNLGVAMMIKDNMKLLREQHRYPDWYNLPPGAVKPTPDEDIDKLSKYQLFDLDKDPSEVHNLKDKMPELKDEMAKDLRQVREMAKEPIDIEMSDKSNPINFGYVWSPGWC